MGSSSRDLNELPKTCSQDFQLSEQDRTASEQQSIDEYSSGRANIDEEREIQFREQMEEEMLGCF
jgi:hypothetical protein